MPTHLTTQELRQGSAGFLLRLDFEIKGFTDSYLGQNWKVKIICPDGTALSKTTGIEFLEDEPKISVPIVDFDLIQAGVYWYQVTLITGGANIHSSVESFEIASSLPENPTYSVISSSFNYFPIFTSNGSLTQSGLRVDEDTDLNYTGGAKFSGDVKVPDEAFGVSWNNNLEVPTKNALYDYLSAYAVGLVMSAPITGGGNNRLLYQGASGELSSSINLTYDGLTLSTRAQSQSQTANIFEVRSYDGITSLQVSHDGKVTLGRPYNNSDTTKHNKELLLQYNGSSNYATEGIRIVNNANTAVVRLHSTTSGGLLLTKSDGTGATLVVDSWSSPSGVGKTVFTSGAFQIQDSALYLNRTISTPHSTWQQLNTDNTVSFHGALGYTFKAGVSIDAKAPQTQWTLKLTPDYAETHYAFNRHDVLFIDGYTGNFGSFGMFSTKPKNLLRVVNVTNNDAFVIDSLGIVKSTSLTSEFDDGDSQYQITLDASSGSSALNTSVTALRVTGIQLDTHGESSTGQVRLLRVDNGTNEFFSIWRNGNVYMPYGKLSVGVPENSNLAAGIQVRKTTEQLRLEYDLSNYLSVLVGSNGTTQLLPFGSEAKIILNGTTTTLAGSMHVGWDSSSGYGSIQSDTGYWRAYAASSYVFAFGLGGINESLVGLKVPDEPYSSTWNNNLTVPTKKSIYTKIEALGNSGMSVVETAGEPTGAFPAYQFHVNTITGELYFSTAANTARQLGVAGLSKFGTLDIVDAAVTYQKIQNISGASKLLGRGASGSGQVQEISLGVGLSMSGTTLSVVGGGTGGGTGPSPDATTLAALLDFLNLEAPTAPTNPIVDDSANTFNWTNVVGYTDVADYEYTVDGGATWNPVASKPIDVGNMALAAGQVGVRVKETSSNLYSPALFSTAAYTTSGGGNITPPTPSNPVVDDIANTFDWTYSSGYTSATDYEYTTNGGSSYSPVTVKPIFLGNVAIASGQVGVRVKAATGRNVSSTLYSNAAYTTSSGGQNVTWVSTTNVTTTATTIYNTNAASLGRAHSMQTISPASESYFEYRGDATTGLNALRVGLRLASGAPYTDWTAANYLLYINELGDIYVNGLNDSNIALTDESDKVGIGFNSAGKMQIWKNDTVAWTYSGDATPTADYILYFIAFNDLSPANVGIRDIICVNSGMTYITPDTPTVPVVNDTANTFDWTYSSGYANATDYEYTIDGGTTYSPVTVKPINVGNVALSVGQVGVRVKAASGRNASGTLYNTTAFTVTSGGTGNVTWQNTSGVTISSPNITKTGGVGAGDAVAHSVQTLNASGSGYFQMDRTATVTNSRVGAALLPSSGVPYNIFHPPGTTSYGFVFGSNFCQIEGSAGGYVTDFSCSATDTIRIGFDGSGHIRIWKNGVTQWTSTETFTGEFVLYARMEDRATAGEGLENVTYSN